MVGQAAPRPFTYAEYRLLPADGRVWELIDGDFHVNPAPASFHQVVSRRLQFALMAQLEVPGTGDVFNAPTDLILSDTSVVQPDLVVFAAEKRGMVTARGIEGVPDLVVEILSPSNRLYDQVLKRGLYERHRVPTYWLVDPSLCMVDVFQLTDGAYRQLEHLDRTATLRSAAFPDLAIALAPIFAPYGNLGGA